MVTKLLKDLSKAVSYVYRKDATCPGVLISTLKDGSIYSSVVRYGNDDGFKNGKRVVCKSVGADIETAIKGLCVAFVIAEPADEPNPMEVLRNSIDKK